MQTYELAMIVAVIGAAALLFAIARAGRRRKRWPPRPHRQRLDLPAAKRRGLHALDRPSPVLARCDQAGDIAAGLEQRRRLPLPAPDETPTTRGGAA
jgi:hypothetical protein